MSDNLSKLKFASIEPPPTVWERLGQRLSVDNSPEQVEPFSELHQIAIAPPPEIKDLLFDKLDAFAAPDNKPAKVYDLSKNRVFPQSALHKSKLHKKIYLGVAGAIIGLSGFLFAYFNQNSQKSQQIK